jgi:hypothetical protein
LPSNGHARVWNISFMSAKPRSSRLGRAAQQVEPAVADAKAADGGLESSLPLDTARLDISGETLPLRSLRAPEMPISGSRLRSSPLQVWPQRHAARGVRLAAERRKIRLPRSPDRYLRGIETTVVAAPDSLLGLLQRGRGQGYLNALASPARAAEEAIIECLTHDPRLDPQLEGRDEYYGRCAFALHLDIAPLEAMLFGPADSEETNQFQTGLVLGTLAWMGRLGREDAVKALRRYVEIGRQWDWAIEEMATPVPVGLERLDEVVVARNPSVEDLAKEMRGSRGAPWNAWRATNPRIREASSLCDQWDRENDQKRQELAKLSTTDLLERREGSLLRSRTTAADRELLHEAAQSEVDELRRLALKVLGWQGDADVFDAAEAELRRIPDRDWPPNAGWFALSRLMRDGPIERVRPWLAEEGKPRQLALHMVALWPRGGDERLLRGVLEHLNDQDWHYRVCDAVEGLAKLADREAVPGLERVFREARYSHMRRRAAQALAITSDYFAEGFAVECLWDCEDETRGVGCAVASWSSAEVRARIATIAGDRFEPRSVRVLAARRERALTA